MLPYNFTIRNWHKIGLAFIVHKVGLLLNNRRHKINKHQAKQKYFSIITLKLFHGEHIYTLGEHCITDTIVNLGLPVLLKQTLFFVVQIPR